MWREGVSPGLLWSPALLLCPDSLCLCPTDYKPCSLPGSVSSLRVSPSQLCSSGISYGQQCLLRRDHREHWLMGPGLPPLPSGSQGHLC